MDFLVKVENSAGCIKNFIAD